MDFWSVQNVSDKNMMALTVQHHIQSLRYPNNPLTVARRYLDEAGFHRGTNSGSVSVIFKWLEDTSRANGWYPFVHFFWIIKKLNFLAPCCGDRACYQ